MESKRSDRIPLDDRLRFEELLTDLSSRFVDVPCTEVDDRIEEALRQLVEFLDIDRSGFLQLDETGKRFRVTHFHALPGIEPLEFVVVDDRLPSFADAVRRGETLRIESPSDIPRNAIEEKEYVERSGLKSSLTIPLEVGGRVLGALGLASFRAHRTWPDTLVRRLRLVGHVFASALARQRAEREILRLKDRLEKENVYLRDEVRVVLHEEEFVGESPAIQTVLRSLEKVAKTDSTVLLVGETGTGKELLARRLHAMSLRADRVMVAVNCAALPATLVENELFGRAEGAYTGAHTAQAGRFEVADGSTIFLDEIGELPAEVQAKLLRVIQEGEFERLGSTETLRVNVRIVAATNRDLGKLVREGSFREDLYYRIAVFPVEVPPLRERTEEIPILVRNFIEEFSQRMHKKIKPVPQRTMDSLLRYPWPGNVRELRNVIERAAILSEKGELPIDLTRGLHEATPSGETLEDVERQHILAVLERTGWRVRGPKGAATILDLKPTTLESRMRKLGIERPA